MKFVNFCVNQANQLGVILEDETKIYALSSINGYDFKTMVELIRKMGTNGFSELKTAISNTPDVKTFNTADVSILCPIPRPIHDILCVGVNYSDHYNECQAEMPMAKPEKAVYFSKRSSNILGAFDDVPHISAVDTAFDYEVELAVIIGKDCKDVKASDAENYIFGYSVFNDLSARTLQKDHNQWYKGKGLDNTSILGPYIVSKNDIAYPPQLDIKCLINDEVRQSSNTKMFIHNIGELIADLSAGCTLEAGDIIITGTPAGVGMGFTPPKYLVKGDVMECVIENIGSIKNKIV